MTVDLIKVLMLLSHVCSHLAASVFLILEEYLCIYDVIQRGLSFTMDFYCQLDHLITYWASQEWSTTFR